MGSPKRGIVNPTAARPSGQAGKDVIDVIGFPILAITLALVML